MKEATGELSNTVITVVAIAAILTLFTVFLYPSLKSAIRARTYCHAAVQCTACVNGKQECHYYIDDNSTAGVTMSTNTIECDCSVGSNRVVNGT